MRLQRIFEVTEPSDAPPKLSLLKAAGVETGRLSMPTNASDPYDLQPSERANAIRTANNTVAEDLVTELREANISWLKIISREQPLHFEQQADTSRAPLQEGPAGNRGLAGLWLSQIDILGAAIEFRRENDAHPSMF